MTTHYTPDLNAGLTQVLQDGTNSYLYGNGRIAQQDATTTEYFLGDALGSVRNLVDQSGEVTLTQSYEPYGEVLASDGAGETDYAFTGESFDSYIKLINLRSRMYSPYLNQFVQPDDFKPDYKNPQSLNLYTYVLNNPILFTDHSGHDVDCSLMDSACMAEKARDESFYLDAARFSQPWTGPARDPKTSAFAQKAFSKYQEVSAVKCPLTMIDILTATSHAEFGNLNGEIHHLSVEALGRQFYYFCGPNGECKDSQLWIFLGGWEGWYNVNVDKLLIYMQNPVWRLDADTIRYEPEWRSGQKWDRPWSTGNLSLYTKSVQEKILNTTQGSRDDQYFRLDTSQPSPFVLLLPGQQVHWQLEK